MYSTTVNTTSTLASNNLFGQQLVNPDIDPSFEGKIKEAIDTTMQEDETPLGGYSNPYINFKPRDKTVGKILEELKDAKIFRGGKDADFIPVKKLMQEWINLALSEEKIIGGKPKIKRAENKWMKSHYESLSKPWFARFSTRGYSQRDIRQDAYSVIKDAMIELEVGKRGLATIEYDILKIGGMFIGFRKNEAWVYFPSYARTILDKLMGDGKKKKQPNLYEPQILGNVTGGSGGSIQYTPSVNIPPGSIGIGGMGTIPAFTAYTITAGNTSNPMVVGSHY